MPRPGQATDSPEGPVPHERVPIVGIGASAGGIEALERFFTGSSPGGGVAYVVILHLDPSRKSRVSEVLATHSPFPVTEVTEPVEVEPEEAYVIAPHTELVVEGDRLVPRDLPDGRPYHPVDAFLRSLAKDREEGSIGVILSGTGTDGSLGLRAIQEAGGITVAQAPEDALNRGMPESAISVGRAEIVLPAGEIQPRILAVRAAAGLGLSRRASAGTDGEAATEVQLPETAVDRLTAALHRETGQDFSGYKKSTFLRRVDRRMRVLQLRDLDEYARRVERDGQECRALFRDLLISVSRFFRDPEVWEEVEREVIPHLFEGKEGEDSVRVWVAGCATGEEAYTLAILLHEHASTLSRAPHIQIFATDIDQDALHFAREAVYPESIAEDVGRRRLKRFFNAEPGSHRRVARQIRESVLFSIHDLLSDPPFSNLDLVSCRNLLIYLDAEAQQAAIERLHYGLREGGYLLLGTAESVGHDDYFEPASTEARIFRRLPGRTPLPLNGIRSPRASSRALGEAGQGDGPRHVSPEAIHGRLLRENGPPSLVVDEKYRIVHVSKGMGRFLQYREGAPTDDLLKLVSEPLELELRTALFRAFRNGEWSSHLVRTEVEGKTRLVELQVRAGRRGTPMEGYALVTMEEKTREPEGGEGLRTRSANEQMVQELEDELRKTKQHLRTTIEERETTIEELQTANEELKSANEEQQAAREELEARREELQSMNEELSTINQEHRNKIEELAEVNADLQNLMASIEIATVFLNREKKIRRFTPLATEIFNLVPSDEGRTFSHITHHLKGVGNLVAECDRVLQTGEAEELEAQSEDRHWYSVRVLPYRTGDLLHEDSIDGVVITCYDVTERKAIEDDLRQARDQARIAERTKGDFVATVSHEFRTPLNAIMGYAELLGDEAISGPLTERQAHYLERIAASVHHLDFMIQQIFTFSRMEEGGEAVQAEPADVHDILREVRAIVEPQAAEKKLELDVELGAHRPDGVLDPGKVRQILLNLAGNAVKFTDEGRIEISVQDEDEDFVFEVRDTGVGIAPEDQEKVFQRFWQGRPGSHLLGEQGTGLGLTVTRGLVELLGGTMEVESEPGQGSTFRVRLPHAAPEAEDHVPEPKGEGPLKG